MLAYYCDSYQSMTLLQFFMEILRLLKASERSHKGTNWQEVL